MNVQESAKDRLLADLGYKPLNRTWAKVEILFGLVTVFVGLILGNWSVSQPLSTWNWTAVTASLILFVFGGYLALAGHRSHLYQSQNELIAYLTEKISRHSDRG